MRSGHRRRTVHTITAQVARLASSAIIRYASTCASGRARSQVESQPDSEDHTGPYTAGVLTQIGPTNFHSASVG